MAGPWEKYQAQAEPAEQGPWAKYQKAAPTAPANLPTPAGVTPSMALGMQALSQNPKTRGVTLQSSTIPKPPAIPYSDPVNRAIIGTAAKVSSGIPTTLPQAGNAYLGAMDLATGGGITALRRGKQYGQQTAAGNPPPAVQIVGDARDDIARTVGLDPDAIREAARNRDIPSLLSETIPPVLAVKGMASAATMPAEAGMEIPGVKIPTSTGLRRVVDRAVLGSETPAQILTRALKPPVTYPEFEAVVAQRLPEIVGQINKTGPVTGVKGFAKAVDELAGQKNLQYQNLKTPVLGQSLDTSSVADAQVASIPATNLFETPGIKGSTAAVANRYRPVTTTMSSGKLLDQFERPIREPITTTNEPLNLGRADDIRVDTNAKLKAFYDKSGGDQFAALSDPRTARIKAVNDTIRDSVYNKIQDTTGIDPRPIQNAYGDFTDLGTVAGKRGTVYSRQQPIPLQEQISAADALARGNPMKFALAKLFSRYGNSDALTRIALDRANLIAPPSTQPLRVTVPSLGAGFVVGAGGSNR
jgi:hypothetical protein